MRLANSSADDSFHEIQLNGKQLVFLFMAATVVTVVIFLCGVLVGRGVRAERGGPIADASLSALPVATDQPGQGPASSGGSGTAASGTTASAAGAQPQSSNPPQPAAGSDPRTAAPPPTVDDLTYYKRLDKQKPPADELKKQPASPPKASANAAPPPPPQEQPSAKGRASVPSLEPAGQGFSIQIAALGERSDADALAKGLSSKGYSAYVLAPPNGAPSVFRVRVGKFNSLREAESVAAKLKKDEHFSPWITR